MRKLSRLKMLSPEEVNAIYEKAVDFLSNKGVQVQHPEALKMLAKAGAQVDFDNQQVKFPRDITEWALKTVPHSILLAGQDERHNSIVPHPEGLFYVWASTGCRYYVEPYTNIYREVNLADVANWGQLIEALDNIDHAAILTPMDAPPETADIHSLKTILENTSKHIYVQPHSIKSVGYIIELAAAVAGGTEALSKKPVLHMFAGSVAPFIFKDMDAEIILQSCRHRIPVEVQSLTCMGATTPVTIAGNLIVGTIEILAELVMSQLFQPGNPVLTDSPGGSMLDMTTGQPKYSSIEAILAMVSGVQIAKDIFQAPTRRLGWCSDAYIPDGQAVMEVSLRAILTALAGLDVIGSAGRLASLTAISYVQLILDDTLASILKRILRGVVVDEDTMAWQDILATAPGGHFLDIAHTLKHCRDALRPGLLDIPSREPWMAEGSKDLATRAADKYEELKKGMKPLELPEEVKKELRRIVKHADEHLVK